MNPPRHIPNTHQGDGANLVELAAALATAVLVLGTTAIAQPPQGSPPGAPATKPATSPAPPSPNHPTATPTPGSPC